MTHGFMVVTAGQDGTMEGVLQGNIDMPFVCENMVVVLPVQETGPEGSSDVF